MQIVIDISDKVYGLLKYFEKAMGLADKKENDDVKTALMRAVVKGTPLPKGHGDLIDRNEAEKIADKMFECITSPLLNHIQTYDVYNLLEATPTIIEADKEKSEGK